MPLKYPCPHCGQFVYTTFPEGSSVECKFCLSIVAVPLNAREVPISEALPYFSKERNVDQSIQTDGISRNRYIEAYSCHYLDHDIEKALNLYNKLIDEHPKTDEACRAKIQIEHIERMTEFEKGILSQRIPVSAIQKPSISSVSKEVKSGASSSAKDNRRKYNNALGWALFCIIAIIIYSIPNLPIPKSPGLMVLAVALLVMNIIKAIYYYNKN